MKKWFGAITLLILIISCTDRANDVQIKEAAKIHLKATAKQDSIRDILVKEKMKLEALLETESLDTNKQNYKALLSGVNNGIKYLDEWSKDVIGVPGLKHHEGHSHSHNEEILENMSDREILELQKAYSNKLDTIGVRISEVITTIELYSQNAKKTEEK